MPFDAERFAMLRNPDVLMRELKPSGDRYAIAARIGGPAQSAFPDGIEGRKDGLKSADNINVIVVADTDMLSDRMWVQVQDFFGQRVPQPWADNSGFAINALDNLAGSEALISVRSRGRFTRPFTVVESLQREAETRFREQEQVLQQRLADTEEKLASLQKNQDPTKALELTPEQQATPAAVHAGEGAHPQGAARGQLPAERRYREARPYPQVHQHRPGAAGTDPGRTAAVVLASSPGLRREA